MQVCIHRGTKQIGGTCVELISLGKRILVDLGLPLDAKGSIEAYLPYVAGLSKGDNSILGVFISHGHVDHCGLLNHINKEIPIYIGRHAKEIIRAAAPFMQEDWPSFEESIDLEDRKSIIVGPFKITPYLVDHSAYDAYTLLTESEGKRLFYSGDFRIHGRKRSLVDRLMANPPDNLDVLLLEGTTIGRENKNGTIDSEQELESHFKNEFQKSEGLTLVHCSSQNIDRIVTIYRACKKAGKKLVIDLYTAAILEATGNNNIPQSYWGDVCLFVPLRQRVQIKNINLFPLLDRHSLHRIYQHQLSESPADYVVLFRLIHIWDINKMRIQSKCKYIYSQWDGYWYEDSFASVREWIKSNGIEKKNIHTSGHSGKEDLIRFAKDLAPRKIVPIHTFYGKEYSHFFENVVLYDDALTWNI
jgi:ribonuclease J